MLLIGEGKDQIVKYPTVILSKGPSLDSDIVNVDPNKCTLTPKGLPNGGFQEVLVDDGKIPQTLFQAV